MSRPTTFTLVKLSLRKSKLKSSRNPLVVEASGYVLSSLEALFATPRRLSLTMINLSLAVFWIEFSLTWSKAKKLTLLTSARMGWASSRKKLVSMFPMLKLSELPKRKLNEFEGYGSSQGRWVCCKRPKILQQGFQAGLGNGYWKLAWQSIWSLGKHSVDFLIKIAEFTYSLTDSSRTLKVTMVLVTIA